MPTATFDFNFKPNISLQVGDIMYYVVTTIVSGADGGDSFNTGSQDDIVRVGDVTAITDNSVVWTITCNVADSFYFPSDTLPYMFFGKDNKFNTGSIIGHYAEIKFTNDSIEKDKKKGEMFAASCEIYESSK